MRNNEKEGRKIQDNPLFLKTFVSILKCFLSRVLSYLNLTTTHFLFLWRESRDPYKLYAQHHVTRKVAKPSHITPSSLSLLISSQSLFGLHHAEQTANA